MSYGNLQYLPVISGLWFIFTIIFMYIFAVLKKDVEPIFPYISDTGTFVPESCVFGQLVNTGSILIAIVLYIRYAQLKQIELGDGAYRNFEHLNKSCLYLGWCSTFGLSLVANFQRTNNRFMHFIGAILSFGFGGLYQFLGWALSCRVYPKTGSNVLNGIRLCLAVISTGMFLAAGVFALLGHKKYKVALIAYVRYVHVNAVERAAGRTDLRKLNVASLHLGWLSAFGLTVVANFQKTNLRVVHFLGASLGFGLGIIYQFIAWKVSVKLYPETGSRAVNATRLVIAISSLVGFLVCVAFAILARLNYKGKDITKWKPEDGGYVYHLISTIFEWVCAVSTMIYITTYYYEFKTIRINEPVVVTETQS